MARTYRRLNMSYRHTEGYLSESVLTGETKIQRVKYLHNGVYTECKYIVDIEVMRIMQGKDYDIAFNRIHSDNIGDWSIPKAMRRNLNKKHRAQTRTAINQIRTGYKTPDSVEYPLWERDGGWYYF